MFKKVVSHVRENKVAIVSSLTVASTVCASTVLAADTPLVLPTIDVVPYLNMYTGWLTTNLPTLLSVAGGIGLVSFAFRKSKSFLFG